MVLCITAWAQNVAGNRRDKKKLKLTEFRDQLLEQLHGVVEGALGRHHQVALHMVSVVLRDAFRDRG
jgi:hypothetical protein